MRFGIIGVGGIGGYYAAVLARAGYDVHLLAREPQLTLIRQRGIEARTSEEVWQARVTADSNPARLATAFQRDDCIIVAVKGYDLDAVIPAIRLFAERGVVVLPLLNGVDVADRLVRRGVHSDLVVGGLTAVSCARVAPGVFERRSPFQRVAMGELPHGTSERVDGIAAAFRRGGVDAIASTNIIVDLWRKFAFITSLSAACAIERSPIGPIRQSAHGPDLIEQAIHEVTTVGRKQHVLTEDDAASTLSAISSLPPDMVPSLLRDLQSNRPTEVDTLSGAVVRMGRELGIGTPVHEAAVRAIADQYEPS